MESITSFGNIIEEQKLFSLLINMLKFNCFSIVTKIKGFYFIIFNFNFFTYENELKEITLLFLCSFRIREKKRS